MDTPRVRIRLEPGAQSPSYQTDGSAGADIRAFLAAPLTLAPGERALVPTGMSLELPQGYEAQVRSRSGLAASKGIACLNAPGTIDSDYRGEVKVILINHGGEAFTVESGDRIAQLVVAPVSRAEFETSEGLTDSGRGSGGFGSTGR